MPSETNLSDGILIWSKPMQNRNFNDLYAFTQVVKLGNFSWAAQSPTIARVS